MTKHPHRSANSGVEQFAEVLLSDVPASAKIFLEAMPGDRLVAVRDKRRRVRYVVFRIANPLTPRQAWLKTHRTLQRGRASLKRTLSGAESSDKGSD